MRIGHAVLALALLATSPLAAQQAPRGTCQLEWQSHPDARLRIATQETGARHFFFGGGFIGLCRAQGVTIRADSAEYFEDRRLIHLYTGVHYTEPRVDLTSTRATYWLNTEHVRAQGNVVATLPSGTTLRGPVLDYYRLIPPVRTEERMVATGRPTIDIVERGADGRISDPVRVVANTVTMVGDTWVYAGGRVVITRPDLVARGDSGVLNQETEHARLLRNPVIEGSGERPFTLEGRIVDVYARARAVERVVASMEARGISEDVTITGDTIDFRVTEGRVQRGFVWGASRARAVAPEYDMLADSLDVIMPGQRMEEVRAVGSAFATSRPDTGRFLTEERDWIRGDTIYAYFDTDPTPTTEPGREGQPPIRQLLAITDASSFYQTSASDTTLRLPAVNYVRGRTIALGFEGGEVRQVLVTDQASGVYLEPQPPPAADREAQRPPARGRSARRAPPRAPR